MSKRYFINQLYSYYCKRIKSLINLTNSLTEDFKISDYRSFILGSYLYLYASDFKVK
jgi:hypothetical protein